MNYGKIFVNYERNERKESFVSKLELSEERTCTPRRTCDVKRGGLWSWRWKACFFVCETRMESIHRSIVRGRVGSQGQKGHRVYFHGTGCKAA